MNEQRRYDDREVAEILERATDEPASDAGGPGRSLESGTGLTLSELEDIGTEVGIRPERIAEAARALDRPAPVSAVERTYLGAPRSVSRSVHIDRALTDDEWSRLVADLRRTFHAKGRVESHAGLRSWTNSNLQVHVEPEGSGYVVRMSTVKGNVAPFTFMGGVFLLMGILATLETGGGFLAGLTMRSLILMGIGLGQIAWVRATLPHWALTRAEQMEGLAERIPLLLEE